MDWNKYKSFGNNYYDCNCKVNFWDIINDKTTTNAYKNYPNDNVVADVTDSYKELSSERIK